MSTNTQKRQLLDHLARHKSITSLEAVRLYSILRPSNRIQELKSAGYNIATEIVWKQREDGTATHYARYSMEA